MHKKSLDEFQSIDPEEIIRKRTISNAMEEITIARSMSIDHEVLPFSDSSMELLVERGIIREMMLKGDFEKAEEYLNSKFPELWEKDINIRVSIWALQFIELLKEPDQKKAIHFATEHFNETIDNGKFVSRDTEGYEKILNVDELFSLLCYEKIDEPKIKHLFSPIQREAVGDYINNKILDMKGSNEITSLEKMLKQLVLVQNSKMEKQNIQSTFKLKV